MPLAPSNGLEIWYETFGEADDVPLLLVMGLGAQAVAWDEALCQILVDRGFFVIRYDNRDVGLSTKIESPQVDFAAEIAKAFTGGEPNAPYRLSDMAADAAGLLDHLGIDAAHIVGASMGGMIVQQIAIDFPQRVLSLTSIMSTTGDSDVGAPNPDAMATLMRPPATSRDEAIEASVETWKIIGSPTYFDEDEVRARGAAAYDRSFYPVGVGRQLLGILASPSRSDALREVKVPTLVIHGAVDPLVTVSGGRRTAEVVPGAEYLEIDDMAHDMPRQLWPVIVEAITRNVAKAGEA